MQTAREGKSNTEAAFEMAPSAVKKHERTFDASPIKLTTKHEAALQAARLLRFGEPRKIGDQADRDVELSLRFHQDELESEL